MDTRYTPNQVLLTTSEVAAECRVSTDTVRRWAASGALPSLLTPGGQRRFRRPDVDALLSAAAEEAQS